MGIQLSYAYSSFERYGQQTTALRNVETGRFASIDDARRTTFLWHSMGDACPQCRSLNGKIYEDQDIFNTTLWDPIWGDILNLETGQKLTHGHTGINCRCTCEVRVVYDIAELEPVMELKELLEMLG